MTKVKSPRLLSRAGEHQLVPAVGLFVNLHFKNNVFAKVCHVCSWCSNSWILSNIFYPIFTVHNSSCGKVMFSQVSVCTQGEVYTPVADTPPPRLTPLWEVTPLPDHTATAADGKHATVMHSCSVNIFTFTDSHHKNIEEIYDKNL